MKSAQQRFNERLEELRLTTSSVNKFVDASVKKYDGSYAYATGALVSVVLDLIDQLPKAKRNDVRQRFERLAASSGGD